MEKSSELFQESKQEIPKNPKCKVCKEQNKHPICCMRYEWGFLFWIHNISIHLPAYFDQKKLKSTFQWGEGVKNYLELFRSDVIHTPLLLMPSE